MEIKATLLRVIIAIFIIFIAASNPNLFTKDIMNYIIVALTFMVIQIIAHFIEKYRVTINIFQVILLLILINNNMEIVIVMIPPVIYSLLVKDYRKTLYTGAIAIVISLISESNIVLFILYSLIIYLYMDSVYKNEMSEIDLKSNYKIEREENQKLIERLAYMDNYRKHTNTMAQINERSYIAQSLHDKLGHSVTSSIMQLQVSKAMMDKDKNISMEYLESAIENLSEGMDDIRLILRNLKPQEQIIGIESIKTLLSEFQNNSNIFTEIKVVGDISKIDSDYWIVIEDNLKEALTNSYKYSKATKIKMGIEVYNKFVRIDINDNGKGCFKISKGLGLRGMEERIKTVDGTISFLNQDGFSISMIIGLQGEEREYKNINM